MNKLSKRTLLLAVALCVLGIILFAIGAGTGGIRDLASAGVDNLPSSGSMKEYQMEKTKLDDFDSLNIDVSYMDIHILPSEDDACYLAYNLSGNDRKNPFQYHIENGVLSVKEDLSAESGFFIGIDYSFLAKLADGRVVTDTSANHMEPDQLTLWMPADKMLSSVVISGGDGDIDLSGLSAGQLSVEASYGDLTLSGVQADSGNFTLGDGDIQADSLTLKQMDLDASYGDVSVRDSSLENVSFHAGDGDFSCDNTVFHGDCQFTLSYGDADFRLEDSQKSALSFDLKTSYGEISVSRDIPDGASIGYEDEDVQSYQRTGTAPEDLLTVECDDGDILIR